jgi:hypothetical protein
MSAPLYGVRPPVPDLTAPTPGGGEMSVSVRLIRLDAGWFSLSLMPGRAESGTGLPAVRVSLPPGPPGRRETVSISPIRGDGWMTAGDQPIVLHAVAGGGEILVTQYVAAGDPASAPALKLARLDLEMGATTQAGAAAQAIMQAPSVAEVVAHIEGVGDVDGKFGDWVGMRGSGRAIEGFGLNPRQALSTDDFDTRAVLGRDWLSPWVPGGRFCGSRGLALPLRGFCVRLHPAASARYDLGCHARFVDGTEIGPVPADRICAAPSLAALEAFQLQLRPRVP